jgi:hypothetical protein
MSSRVGKLIVLSTAMSRVLPFAMIHPGPAIAGPGGGMTDTLPVTGIILTTRERTPAASGVGRRASHATPSTRDRTSS